MAEWLIMIVEGSEKDQHGGVGVGGVVVLGKSNLKRGECDPAPP